MDDDTAYCIEVLVEAIEEDDDGGWKYPGSAASKYERIPPIVIENLDLDPDALRISPALLEGKLHDLIFEVRGTDKPAQEVEERLPEFKEGLYDRGFDEYIVAFPLNFDSREADLLPESLQVGDVTFERLPHGRWEERFVPDYGDDHPKSKREQELREFVDQSPNQLDHSEFTYWFASFRARDEQYAVGYIAEQLEILLGMMNYSATRGRIQIHSQSSKPWPDRWKELREPFVYLVHDDCGFVTHYRSSDATPREADSPKGSREEVFETILDGMPTFEDEQPLDGRLLNALRAFQAAITEPSERESFFEFWRGVEILTLVEEDEQMTSVVERAAALINWTDPELGRIRRERAQKKRNEYVHEGAGLRVTVADRNLVKTLHESLISHYIDKREEWGYEEMKFALERFTMEEGQIEQLRAERERELELIDWFEEIAEQN